MALNVTLSAIRTEVYERADVDDNYVPTAEMNRLINGSLRALYRMMVRASKDWFLSSTTLSVAPGGSPYTLAADHWRVQKVLVLDDGKWHPLKRWGLSDVCALQGGHSSPASSGYRVQGQKLNIYPLGYTWSASVKVWYTPAPPELVNDTDHWDGVAGWEEWVILDCCLKLAVKQEEDPSALISQRAELWHDIAGDASEVDDAEPGRIRDVSLEILGLDEVPT